MSDKKPYDTSIARMAGNIAAGIIVCVEPSSVTEAEREQTVDLAVDLAQRIVRRLTQAPLPTPSALEALKAHDAYMSRWYESPESSGLHPEAAENWRRIRYVLAVLDAKESR